jgi:PAS domain S-box-containing protein
MADDHASDPAGEPDDRFRVLVESVTDYAIFLLDAEGFVKSWNPGAERIKGYEAGEIVGRHFSTFYTQPDVDAGFPQRELVLAKRDGRFEDNGWRVRKDGSQFWARVVITPAMDAAGRHVGFAKVTQDLTDRGYRKFVEATHAIVWTTDADGRPNADSPSWRSFTGQTEEEWRGLRGWEPVHPDDQPKLRVDWPRAKAEKSVFESEFRLLRRDGTYVWMAARAVPFLHPDGSVREWFGVTFDISARKAAELERAEALERERSARLSAEHAESLLTTTLRSIGDAVIATDLEGRVTFMNPIAEALTGFAFREARGRPLSDVFSIANEETRRPLANPVERVLREAVIVGLANHTVLVRPDGREVPIDDSAAPIRDPDGTMLGVVMVFRDATLEKLEVARRGFLVRAGEALISSEDYRDSLATVAQLAVPRLADWCAVEVLEPGTGRLRQLAVAHVDPAKVSLARELALRYPADPAAPTGAPNVVRTGRSELYPEIPRELLDAGAIDDEHRRIIHSLGLRSAMVVPLRGRERVFGAITFAYAESYRRYAEEDLAVAEELARRAAVVIERRKLEEERQTLLERERTAREQAEIANRAKDDFLATVSHELRNPLNAMLGWTKLLLQKEQPAEIRHPLETIERNARAQARLIEDVLDVSRIISGKLRLDLGQVSVREIVDDAIEAVRSGAEAKGITLTVEVESGLELRADQVRLQQIVSNLVSNAVKFTQAGGRVSVEALQVASNVRIGVRDTGEGIDAALLRTIFEPFRQADPSTARRHGGLGLGLAIVQQLVHAHGGSVRAESPGKGRGATFTVDLPARPSPRRLATTRVRTQKRPELSGTRVLVVDDEPDVVELMRVLLSESGATVETASSALEALEKVGVFRPDVLVSDIGMPEMDGYSLIRKLRARDAAAGGRTPAVALTAYARREDAERAFAAGFQMHVTKPVDPQEIVMIVANLAGLPFDEQPPPSAS